MILESIVLGLWVVTAGAVNGDNMTGFGISLSLWASVLASILALVFGG